MVLRTPRAFVVVNGTAIVPMSVDVSMSKTHKSDTFHCEIPFGALPPGMNESFWSTANNISVQVQVETDAFGGPVQIFDGKVDQVQHEFDTRVLKVQGRDKTAALIDQTSTEKFTNQQPDQIVQTICGRHGIAANTDSIGNKAGKIFQLDYAKINQRISEWTVIQKLADLFGMTAYMTGGQVYWKKYPEQLPVVNVTYVPPTPFSYANGNFMRLRTARNLILGRPVHVKVQSWNHKQAKLYQNEQIAPGSGDPLIYNYQAPGLTNDQVEKLAQKRLSENTSHELSFELEMPGDPTVTPRFMMQLSGTGTAYDATHQITTVEHQISQDRGYTMSISAKSKSTKRGS